jgi:hemoglobin
MLGGGVMTENNKSLAAWFREKFGKEPFVPSPVPAATELGPDPVAEVPNSARAASSMSESVLKPELVAAASNGESEPQPEPAAPQGREAESVPEPQSLYEQLGGAPTVDAAVDIFYRKVMADERISHFFDDVDMSRQTAKQKAFLTMAFGGPHHYTGKDMRAAHAHLRSRSWKSYGLVRQLQTQRKHGENQGKLERGLKDSHFDAVLENLRATLVELGVAEHLIAQVNAIAESTRNDVLGYVDALPSSDQGGDTP